MVQVKIVGCKGLDILWRALQFIGNSQQNRIKWFLRWIQIPEVLRADLEKVIILEEMYAAIDIIKTPGTDGLPIELYKKLKQYVGEAMA